MKIAIFHFGFMYSGGGERHPINEALQLEKRGHHVECFAPAIRPDLSHPGLIDQIHPRGFLPKVRVPIPLRDFMSLGLSSALIPLFTKQFEDFDVILSHGQPATWMAYVVAKSLAKNYVTYLHQPARFLYPRPIDLRTGWLTKKDFALLQKIVQLVKPLVSTFDRISVTRARKVLVNSQWIEVRVREIYGLEPLVCYPGVDVHRFSPVRNKSNVRIRDFEIKKPFILTTNRHYPQKGMEYLIQMMSLLLRRCKVTLVLTGDFTSYTSKLIKLAESHGVRKNVVFTNLIREEELVRLYQNADVYAYPSPEEDFGLGPIEAMACGTPPVVWDYAGPCESVHDGKTGLKAHPYSLDDFVDKLVLLLRDQELNRKMGKAGREFIVHTFSWERHVDILESVLTRASKSKIRDELINP